MKNKLNIFLVALLSIGFWSCEDEQDLFFTTPPAEFAILTPEGGTSIVLSPDLPDNPATTISWEAADYGTPTSLTYTIEVAKSLTNFEDIVTVGTTTNTNFTLTVFELNSAAVEAGLTPFNVGELEIRIRSNTGTTDSQTAYSNAITILVTTFSTDLPVIGVPGNHQGWSPSTAPLLAASAYGETDFEGYLWLDGEYKFVAPNAEGVIDWNQGPDYGDDGTFTGKIVEQNEVNCTSPAGYYRLRANTAPDVLTYSAVLTTWGIVGAATPGGWDNSTSLVYNSTTKKWEGTVVLTAGEFKFRANNAWDINFGGPAEAMTQDGPNFSTTAGTYLVELDLSNPREYTYTLTAQ